MRYIDCHFVYYLLWLVPTSTFADGNCTVKFESKLQNNRIIINRKANITCFATNESEVLEYPVQIKNTVNITLVNSTLIILKPDLMKNFKSLTVDTFTCADNNVEFIDPTFFSNLNNVRRVVLNNNAITFLSLDIFKNLDNLTHLEVNNNSLVDVNISANNLEILDLSQNFIENANVSCYNLLLLNLSHNQIENMNTHIFVDRFPKLKALYLDNNNISSISNGVFNKSNELLALDLSHNKISSITSGCFDGLNKLEILLLMDNNLTNIDSNAFHDMQYLTVLRIENNKIRTLDTKLFAKSMLPILSYVYLDNNKWKCENLKSIIKVATVNGIFIQKGTSTSDFMIRGIECSRLF